MVVEIAVYQIVQTDRGRKLEVYIDELYEDAKDRVGLAFNPSGSPEIDMAKALCAGPMHMALYLTRHEPAPNHTVRAAFTAATELEAGQMFLVKAIAHTFKKS